MGASADMFFFSNGSAVWAQHSAPVAHALNAGQQVVTSAQISAIHAGSLRSSRSAAESATARAATVATVSARVTLFLCPGPAARNGLTRDTVLFLVSSALRAWSPRENGSLLNQTPAGTTGSQAGGSRVDHTGSRCDNRFHDTTTPDLRQPRLIYRPVAPSMRSRSRSACPLCRAYSSTMWMSSHRSDTVPRHLSYPTRSRSGASLTKESANASVRQAEQREGRGLHRSSGQLRLDSHALDPESCPLRPKELHQHGLLVPRGRSAESRILCGGDEHLGSSTRVGHTYDHGRTPCT